MTGGELFRRMIFPPAQVDPADSGLRFTDILFGFVIRELFVRLQNWSSLPWFVRWQLIVATILVLGSWIGFRRSLHRPSYQLKFFNIPLIRFALDQTMVVLYFRIAVLTPSNPPANLDFGAGGLTHDTLTTLLLIFALYAIWDLLGMLMASAGPDGNPIYPKINERNQMTKDRSSTNWQGFFISLVALVIIAYTLGTHPGSGFDATAAENLFISGTALLIAYRFAKEVRTSLQFKP
jgi:hypothetical protein